MGALRSPATIEHDKALIAAAVDAGVVERDGRSFRLLRLPPSLHERIAVDEPIVTRSTERRGETIA